MKKSILFILLFSFSFLYCQSQKKNAFDCNQIKKEFHDSIIVIKGQVGVLENKLSVSDSVFKIKFMILSQSLDSIKKSIDDTRLRESLKSADSIINKQNSFIDGFSTVYSILTILIGLLAFGIPLLIYFLTIKPANKALKKAKRNFAFEIKNFTEEQLNEAIENLKSKNNLLIRNSLNHILSLVPKNRFSEKQVYKLFSIVKYENIDSNIKESIVFILINYNFPFCKDYFFDILSEEVNTIENNNLKNYAFNYLIKFHKSETYILAKLNQLIICSQMKKESLLILLDLLVPDNEDLIWKLLNFGPLINIYSVGELKFIYDKILEKDYIIQDFSNITKDEKLLKLKERVSNTRLKTKITELTSENN